MVSSIASAVISSLEIFARGGGGGSGGGGGGGGIEFVLGYLPMHFLGALLRKAKNKSTVLWIIANIGGWSIAGIYAGFWIMMGGYGWLIGICALVGMSAGLYGLFSKLKQSKRVKERLTTAAHQDAAWNQERLVEHAKAIFMRYQGDWSRLDIEAMKTYMTPRYHYHASLLIYTLQLMKRSNLINNVAIQDAVIIAADDSIDNSRDIFTIGFNATAQDELFEIIDGVQTHLLTSTEQFTEYWTFIRSGDTWLLDRIDQATVDPGSLNAQLDTFANQHGYHYSADMGVLFVPKRGYLFGGAKFAARKLSRSDINNHIVGLYNNQLLIQLYTYRKDVSQNNGKSYVVAQASVPKSYGRIVVRRKSLMSDITTNILHPFSIPGLEKMNTEWMQFNNKYDVYASSAEQVTSFELLNPTYMEQLEALGFKVTIEVVDNVVYLYTDERETSVETYATMLDLLNKAFKEMRL